MMSHSDNAYDFTTCFCFEKFLAYTLFLPSFIVVRPQMAELNWEGRLPLVHYRGILDPVQNSVKLLCEEHSEVIQLGGGGLLLQSMFYCKKPCSKKMHKYYSVLCNSIVITYKKKEKMVYFFSRNLLQP